MADTKKKTTAGTAAKRSNTRLTTAKKPTAKQTSTRGAVSKQQLEDYGFIKTEFVVLSTFAVAALFFLSIFHLCGKLGEFLRGGILGLFGILGFAVPVALFVGTCFWMSNRGNKKAIAKLITSVVVFFILCGFAQLIGDGQFDKAKGLADYYLQSTANGKNGGLIGGLICKSLCPLFGTIGAYIILFVICVTGMVFITEKSFVSAVKSGSGKAYHYAKEDIDRRKESFAMKQEEKRNYRAQQKVQGVALDSTMIGLNGSIFSETEDYEFEEVLPDNSNNPADLFRGNIDMPADYSINLKAEEESTIIWEKDMRTLAEIEALDAVRNTKPITAHRTAELYTEPVIKKLEHNLTELPSNNVLSGETQDQRQYNRVKPELDIVDEYEDPFATEEQFFTPQATKTVVTSNGKIIEVDTELTMKKIENRKRDVDSEKPKDMPVQSALVQIPKALPKEYLFPPLSLLAKGTKKVNGNGDRELRETAIKLQQTLQNFGVGVTVTNISCGPSVTRYELQPEQGVKVSKIVSLTDDIKLNLAAADIRIEAPIPGKAAVGIEVPNKENNMVFLRDLLEAEEFRKHPSSIAFAVGKDIAGQTVVTDIGKMPHLLIAGATGSGKSVCINTLIMSIIFKANPEDVKLIMIDPKVVELSVYNGIPHLLIPVVTDPKKASGALNWGVAEMTDRYNKFAEYNVRDLKGYNDKIKSIETIDDSNKPAKLPQIIIIVDELADLMMVAPGEVEDAICRLAQLARAAGIHLVIATQRPSVNVITGLIKANVPSRIAFSVSSGVDSRTIIDMNGAEKLLGKGDMLFYPSGIQKPQRVQGAFVADQEVTKVVEFLAAQGLTENYNTEIEQKISAPVAESSEAQSDRDTYFLQAGKFVIEKEKASIGMLQRVFKIGFNRAARIMDQLSDAGVVGEDEGTKPRKILMTMEEFEEFVD